MLSCRYWAKDVFVSLDGLHHSCGRILLVKCRYLTREDVRAHHTPCCSETISRMCVGCVADSHNTTFRPRAYGKANFFQRGRIEVICLRGGLDEGPVLATRLHVHTGHLWAVLPSTDPSPSGQMTEGEAIWVVWFCQDAEEADISTKKVSRVWCIRTEHQLACPGTRSIRRNNKVKVVLAAVVEADVDFAIRITIGVLRKTGDSGTEPVLHVLALLSQTDQDAHKITTANFKLGGDTLALGAMIRNREESLRFAIGIHQLRSCLADKVRANSSFDAHLSHDRNTLSANIELLTCCSDLRRALYKSDIARHAGEPVGERRASDTAADYKNFERCHVLENEELNEQQNSLRRETF
ncbi:hypothetical protein HG530_015296 [Fusarium avenaceum]|nr:hypothetical protein HG530_015296 [Fusarium avenaceum]